MDIKTNESTNKRPHGSRIIDGPYVSQHLPSVVAELKAEESWKANSRNAITLFKSGGMSIVVIGLHKGEVLDDNEKNALVFFQVLEGSVALQLDEIEEPVEVHEGSVLCVHRQIKHPVTALEDSFILMTLSGE